MLGADDLIPGEAEESSGLTFLQNSTTQLDGTFKFSTSNPSNTEKRAQVRPMFWYKIDFFFSVFCTLFCNTVQLCLVFRGVIPRATKSRVKLTLKKDLHLANSRELM